MPFINFYCRAHRRRSLSQPNLLANLQIPEENAEADINDPHVLATWGPEDIVNLLRAPDLLVVPGKEGQVSHIGTPLKQTSSARNLRSQQSNPVS